MILDEVMKCAYCSVVRYCPYWNSNPSVIGCELSLRANGEIRRDLRVIRHGNEAWEEVDDE